MTRIGFIARHDELVFAAPIAIGRLKLSVGPFTGSSSGCLRFAMKLPTAH
jgi:hypothetical protein